MWPEPAKLHQGLRVGGEGGADAQGFRVEGAAPLRRSAAGGQVNDRAIIQEIIIPAGAIGQGQAGAVAAGGEVGIDLNIAPGL